MKKLFATALFTLSTTAMAGFNGNASQGGFNNGTPAPTTVAAALKAKDNTLVSLTGHITRQIDDDEFYFKDATGEIKIDVEDHAWNGQNITPNDTITIQGKVDADSWGKSDIEVYSIQKQ